MRWATK